MRIKNIELNNFKFHNKLKFDINNKNCLIYGENGTGKSSIYWGLASVFKSKLIDDISKYKNYITDEDASIEIVMDDDTVLRLNEDNEKITNSFNTIYFLNQNFLEEIIKNDNLYEFFEKTLNLQFQRISDIVNSINSFNEQINVNNHIEVIENRQSKTREYDEFLNDLKERANEIIKEYFQEENLILSFESQWGESNTFGNYEFSKPLIKLLINRRGSISINFNEAKLKLIALAIVLALIKLEEDLSNQIKLLVLDDFLTSLDMGNRKYIIEYIFRQFKKYQIVFLTHNLQFFNLSKRHINHYNLSNKWDIKNIFLHNNASMICTKKGYLDEAKQKLSDGEYQISGNLVRKEFERITNELKLIMEVGKQEELRSTITVIKKNIDNQIYFQKPFESLIDLYKNTKKIEEILQQDSPENNKLEQISQGIDSLNLEQFNQSSMQTLKSLIHNVIFYKDIVFNPASHSSEDVEVYRKECEGGIKLLEKFNALLENLR